MNKLYERTQTARSTNAMLLERKYFLDWLRVFVFGVLILYHSALLYVTWDFNLKSPRIYPNLEFLLIAIYPWRLTLLFFISGVACRHLVAKLTPGDFTINRIARLVPVILFGMFVVIPPQSYVQLYSAGLVSAGFMEFWFESYLLADPSLGKAVPTWGHLWFLVYLLFYILIFASAWKLAPNTFKIEKHPCHSITRLLIAAAIWLVGCTILISELYPTTQGLIDDWATHAKWGGIFYIGILCALRHDFWIWVQNHRRKLVYLSITFLSLMSLCRAYWLTGRMDPLWDGITYSALEGLYGWTMLLVLIGYASKYLNWSSPSLTYFTIAVLPIYVLHQPILLLMAYFIFPLQLPVLLESLIIILSTAVGSFAIYEFGVRRFPVTRFLFGLKRVAE